MDLRVFDTTIALLYRKLVSGVERGLGLICRRMVPQEIKIVGDVKYS